MLTYLWIVALCSDEKSGVNIKSYGLWLDVYSSKSFRILDLNSMSFWDEPKPMREIEFDI